MSYFKPVMKITHEMLTEYRENNPGMGLLEAKQALLQSRAEKLKHNALEAVEECRFDATAPYSKVNHTILDLLEYLIRK